MSTTIPPPTPPFDKRPTPSTEANSAGPLPPSAGPTSAKPLPVEFPLTNFSSTPHNVACIAFVLGTCWATGLAFVVPYLKSWFIWTSPATATALELPRQAWSTALLASPQLGWYISSWALFHLLEFVVTSMYNPGKLSVSSYLLDNGNAYHVAHLGGILETILEERYFPDKYRRWKHSGAVFVLGLAVLAAGQILRSFAMISASSNFSHLLAYSKRPDHQLVKTGIYSWSRHPSYAGFYWWAVGTQIVLGNPVCTIVFVGVLQWFFAARIKVEERYLVKFFGQDYEEYRAKVPTRILFLP